MNAKNILVNKTNNTAVQFFRYIFVGGGATVVQYLILIALKEAFGVNVNLANAVGFIGGLITNYIISKYWVFDKSTVNNKAAEFTAFALIGVVGLGINQGLIWLFDNPLADKKIFGSVIPARFYYLVGQVIATGITFFWNFFARKLLLYNKKAEDGDNVNKSENSDIKETIHN